MPRSSSKSIAKISSQTNVSFLDENSNDKDLSSLERKIVLATEGFTTHKFCELVLKDRNRLSKENALTMCDYIIAMRREVNPRLSYKRHTIQILSELSKAIGIERKFIDMTRNDILFYLDNCRKLENEDPLHRWIGTYNSKLITIFRFFKWLHYPNIEDPKRRSELSALEKKPDCIMGIAKLKRKEISCYKPSDLWSQEDDLVFLNWATNKRDRCYHTMARDLSARPHEILNLKIKDIIFKTVDGGKQYAEVLVNGKTGSRHIPLIQSIPYIKDWISNHPSRNNSNSPLFIGLGRRSMGRQLTTNGLYGIYKDYKERFFPKLLEDTTVSNEDKEKIKGLLTKPFNPYIRRHSALTEKSTKLKSSILNQHAGWTANSNMAQKYIHYFGNESSESLLEAYGIVTKNNIPIDTLNPKICPNCNEGNTQDARFCSKCKFSTQWLSTKRNQHRMTTGSLGDYLKRHAGMGYASWNNIVHSNMNYNNNDCDDNIQWEEPLIFRFNGSEDRVFVYYDRYKGLPESVIKYAGKSDAIDYTEAECALPVSRINCNGNNDAVPLFDKLYKYYTWYKIPKADIKFLLDMRYDIRHISEEDD